MNVATDAQGSRPMRLTVMRHGAQGIVLYEFEPVDGQPVEAFSAGSHVDVHLPNGMLRQYSLANDPEESHRYVLGIKLDANSRGGSRSIHETLRPGAVLKIGRPRNNFALDETAPHTVLIAGGIGITPIRCMSLRAQSLGMSWELHYAARSREDAVFADELLSAGRTRMHIDSEHGNVPLDLAGLARRIPASSHAYCCGPAPMLQAFESAFAEWPKGQLHVEHFSAPPQQAQEGGPFDVVLARSGRTLHVPADRSILEVLRQAGIKAAASCEQGICGSCEVRVLGGQPDHRDIILSEEDRIEGKSLMICCSRSRSAELVLDL